MMSMMERRPARDQDGKNNVVFLLCRFCYWCASLLGISDRHVEECPGCGGDDIAAMRVSSA